MVFKNNAAVVGPILYASDLEVCTWFNVNSPFFNSKPQDGWVFMESRDNYILRGKLKLLKPDFNFQTIVKNFSLSDSQESVVVSRNTFMHSSDLIFFSHHLQSATPGENITVAVVASDEYDHETTAFLEIKVHLGSWDSVNINAG